MVLCEEKSVVYCLFREKCPLLVWNYISPCVNFLSNRDVLDIWGIKNKKKVNKRKKWSIVCIEDDVRYIKKSAVKVQQT